MNFESTTEQGLLRDAVRSFVRKRCTRQNVRQWEREHVFPEELHREMVGAGYVPMAVPEVRAADRQVQGDRHMLADMATELEAGHWLTSMAAWRYDQGLPCAREATMAKLYCSAMHVRVDDAGHANSWRTRIHYGS
ncbi:acyl-CoA dehydrogenase family protein [Achromobacter aegrifaciens]